MIAGDGRININKTGKKLFVSTNFYKLHEYVWYFKN